MSSDATANEKNATIDIAIPIRPVLNITEMEPISSETAKNNAIVAII